MTVGEAVTLRLERVDPPSSLPTLGVAVGGEGILRGEGSRGHLRTVEF